MGSIGLHGTSDPIIVVLAALVADALLAGVPGIRQVSDAVTASLRAAALWVETRLNRPHRSRRSRLVRGALVVAVFAIGALAIAFAGVRAVVLIPEGWLVAALLVAIFLRQRRTFDQVRAVGAALGGDRVAAARPLLSRMVAHDTAEIDAHGAARVAVEVNARQTCDGIVAPVFWYLVLGLPGLFVYRAINALAQTVGQPSARLADFGAAAALVNRLLNLVPSGISGVLVAVAASFVPTAHPLRALRTIAQGGEQSPGPSAGWPTRAFAGALGLALAGPVRYDGTAVSFPWVGDGRARVTAQDVRRAAYLFAVTALLVMAIVALLRLAVGGA